MTDEEYFLNLFTGGFLPMIDYIGKNSRPHSDAHFVTIWSKTILTYSNATIKTKKISLHACMTESNKTIPMKRNVG
jgi:hypothetical protein